MAELLKNSGIQYIPPKVETRDGFPSGEGVSIPTDDDLAKEAIRQRDVFIQDLLDNDRGLDILDAALQDQIKNMRIPATPSTEKAIKALGGTDAITADLYNKAWELMRDLPMVSMGFDPVGAALGTKTNSTGQTILNCQDYNPDQFRQRTPGTDTPTATVTTAEAMADAHKKSVEAQQKYIAYTLFWKILYGEPERDGTKHENPKLASADPANVEGDEPKRKTYDMLFDNDGIPKIKQGFILGILIGLLAIPVRIFNKVENALGGSNALLAGLKKVLLAIPRKFRNAMISAMIFVASLPRGTDDEDLRVDAKIQTDPEVGKLNGGFIPPECFGHAKDILNGVMNASPENTTFNRIAVESRQALSDARDQQEQIKFMVYSIDDSDGARRLMENTRKDTISRNRYLNVDAQSIRKSLLGANGAT